MRNTITKFRAIATTALLVGMLSLPALAKDHQTGGGKGQNLDKHNWWSFSVAVPEFSADAASGAAVLLVGGTLILVGSRRKKR